MRIAPIGYFLAHALARYCTIALSYMLGEHLYPVIISHGGIVIGLRYAFEDVFSSDRYNFGYFSTIGFFTVVIFLGELLTPGKMRLGFLALFSTLAAAYYNAMFLTSFHYHYDLSPLFDRWLEVWPGPGSFGDFIAVVLFFFFLAIPLLLLVLFKLFLKASLVPRPG